MPEKIESPPPVRMISVPEPVLRGLVEYLSTRPYREVGAAVPVLERLLSTKPDAGEQGDAR